MYGSYEDEYRYTEGRDLEVSVDRVLKDDDDDDDDDEKRDVRWFGGRLLAIGAVIVVLIAATTGVAVWLRQSKNQETNPSDMISAPISLSTLRQRNTVDDCWMALYGNVYDMTQYNHPGPQALVMTHCGSDATAEYGAAHPEVYIRTIEHLYVGVYESIQDGNQPIGASDENDAAPTVAPTTDVSENGNSPNNVSDTTDNDSLSNGATDEPPISIEDNENLLSNSSTVVDDPTDDGPSDTNGVEDRDDAENDNNDNPPVNNGGIFGNGGTTQDEDTAPGNSDNANGDGDEMDDMADSGREENDGDNDNTDEDDNDENDEGDDDEDDEDDVNDEGDDDEDEDREERTSNVRGEDVDNDKEKKKNKKKDKDKKKKKGD
ncbi:hypothetical protein FisN_26Lh134 [Fistulifera solaris]|uniref:Cytochrome b5 heme-binding domain-containing protein n=1 Tax=Fistulifera solaris TaxID=1519565 RepID=A0A1Z5KCU7_FISSO|nr:hypothetical protein FisN_26Lh134 [Fistulifera solaris]|eukprot:GAX24057.1 hypothetical protein FisN_26Lh134 [Fistulifera solaris]